MFANYEFHIFLLVIFIWKWLVCLLLRPSESKDVQSHWQSEEAGHARPAEERISGRGEIKYYPHFHLGDCLGNTNGYDNPFHSVRFTLRVRLTQSEN